MCPHGTQHQASVTVPQALTRHGWSPAWTLAGSEAKCLQHAGCHMLAQSCVIDESSMCWSLKVHAGQRNAARPTPRRAFMCARCGRGRVAVVQAGWGSRYMGAVRIWLLPPALRRPGAPVITKVRKVEAAL
jgi:hypothetical protein